MTRCLHFTTGCTTGWVNYANEPSQAARERSSQDAYDAQQVGSVDSRPRGAFDRNCKKKNSYLLIYFLPSVAYVPDVVWVCRLQYVGTVYIRWGCHLTNAMD